MTTRTGRILAEVAHTLAALCGDLRDWRRGGRHTPTPTDAVPPSVQAAMTAATYREMAKADPLHPMSNPAYPDVRLIAIELPGGQTITVWVDHEGCSPGMDVHAAEASGYWEWTQQQPPCSHYRTKAP